MRKKQLLFCLALPLLMNAFALGSDAEAAKVDFDAAGTVRVDGKPFFPIGIFTYELNGTVMAEIHEQGFNTIINGFRPDQLDYIRDHGLMAVCFTSDEWVAAAKDHPALLAWYLTDEPESRGFSPESERERYLKLKATDPHHPIGLCHFLFESLTKYKDACDFTMTDVYPITANRDVPVENVGIHIDEARRVHGPGWPNWAYIQIFGGPDTDGGKWAQPLPHEIRCMTFIALAHRATGILYFSYWPKDPRAWAATGKLNRELQRMVPYLAAEGEELGANSDLPEVHVRARKTVHGGIVVVVNTRPRFLEPTITVPGVGSMKLTGITDSRTVPVWDGVFRDSVGPFEGRTYTWGAPPEARGE